MDTRGHSRFRETDHKVKGLFVKEISTVESTSLKTPILMLQGACHGWWTYSKWLPFFAACGGRAYAMSLRNHSGSYAVYTDAYLNGIDSDGPHQRRPVEMLARLEKPTY